MKILAKQGESLDDVLAAINKKYGSGSIMTLGDTRPVATNLLSTGSLMIIRSWEVVVSLMEE